MSTWDKYGAAADRWSEDAYADAAAYLARRADFVVSAGPRLERGDTVLDLACGDGGFASFLPGLRYLGADGNSEMVAAARRAGRDVVEADLNEYAPPEPVQATTIFRAIYYARDRPAFFEHVASYTEGKLVFDLNPRQYEVDAVRGELRAAGFDRVELRPFFVPLTHAPPRPVAALLLALERSGPLARALLRVRFSYLCCAWRGGWETSA
jgi:SAM-dependent methyltransferase